VVLLRWVENDALFVLRNPPAEATNKSNHRPFWRTTGMAALNFCHASTRMAWRNINAPADKPTSRQFRV